MKADPRESILNRLHEIVKSVVGDNNAFRNQVEIPEDVRPAVAIFDADESTDEASYGKGRPAKGPVKVHLTPEIVIMTSTDVDKAGPALSTLRASLLKAILTDASLVAWCCDGDIRFDGFATAFALGRHMEGDAALSVTFVYMLRPGDL